MAKLKLNMRHIHEVLRLKYQNQLSIREIARSCGLPASTVGDYLQRAAAAGLSWPLPEGQLETELLGRLLPGPAAGPGASLAVPDWPALHQELGRKGVTLRLLWQEYRQGQPEGYGYSRFCELYQRWADTLEPVLRQVHTPGERMFVDWAGQTVPIHNAQDGSVSAAHLFVAVLGASNKTYVEAFANEQLGSWISAHCHAWAFFQGVSRVTVPDNLKTGVVRACRYEPLLHRSYQELAEHYGTVIVPARKQKPRDKGKIEREHQFWQGRLPPYFASEEITEIDAANPHITDLRLHRNAHETHRELRLTPQRAWELAQKEKRSVLRPAPRCPWWPYVWSVRTAVKVGADGRVPIGTQRLRLERPPGTKVVLCLHPSGHHSVLAAAPQKDEKPRLLFTNRSK
jgi:transposase